MKLFLPKYATYVWLLLLFGYLNSVESRAFTADSTGKPKRPLFNSVKLNMTSNLVFDHSYQLSYERVIKKYQSFSVFAGYQRFPDGLTLDLDGTTLSQSRTKSGYSFGGDYRFYLANENKHGAPRGVYLAPFFNYFHFSSSRTLSRNTDEGVQSVGLSTTASFTSFGGELGYQFVLGRHFVIDVLFFGPAIVHYQFNAKLDGSLPGVDSDEATKQVIEALKEKIPLFKDYAGNGEFSSSGSQGFWSVGFNYKVSLGFRF